MSVDVEAPPTWAEIKEQNRAEQRARRDPGGQPATYAGGRPSGGGAPASIRAVRRAMIFGHYGRQPKRSRCQRTRRRPRTGGWK